MGFGRLCRPPGHKPCRALRTRCVPSTMRRRDRCDINEGTVERMGVQCVRSSGPRHDGRPAGRDAGCDGLYVGNDPPLVQASANCAAAARARSVSTRPESPPSGQDTHTTLSLMVPVTGLSPILRPTTHHSLWRRAETPRRGRRLVMSLSPGFASGSPRSAFSRQARERPAKRFGFGNRTSPWSACC
jgi:hypothetical protein